MFRRIWKLIFSTSLLLGFIATAQATLKLPHLPRLKRYHLVHTFVGGINEHQTKICRRHVKNASCTLKNMFTDFKFCVRSALKKEKDCQQSLVFFNLTGGALIEAVKNYHNLDVIKGNYLYIANQGTAYFIVTKSGQYLALPVHVSRTLLKKMPGYKHIAKKYPRVGLWEILGFPKGEYLNHHRYRLIFTQQLKDGCTACAIVGTAKVAYDFTDKGRSFSGVKVLRLIPKHHR